MVHRLHPNVSCFDRSTFTDWSKRLYLLVLAQTTLLSVVSSMLQRRRRRVLTNHGVCARVYVLAPRPYSHYGEKKINFKCFYRQSYWTNIFQCATLLTIHRTAFPRFLLLIIYIPYKLIPCNPHHWENSSIRITKAVVRN